MNDAIENNAQKNVKATPVLCGVALKNSYLLIDTRTEG